MKVLLIVLMLVVPVISQDIITAEVDTTIARRELPFFNGMILPDSIIQAHKEPPKIEIKKEFNYYWFGVGVIVLLSASFYMGHNFGRSL